MHDLSDMQLEEASTAAAEAYKILEQNGAADLMNGVPDLYAGHRVPIHGHELPPVQKHQGCVGGGAAHGIDPTSGSGR